MDKRKQIEEMTNIMFEYALAIDGFSPEIQQAMEEVSTKQAIKKALWGYAKALYNAGYRKIPENAVVLTREEYDGKGIVVEMSGGHKLKLSVGKFGEMSKILEEHTRKETAEKFAEMAKKKASKMTTRMNGVEIDELTTYTLSNANFDEIAKEITR